MAIMLMITMIFKIFKINSTIKSFAEETYLEEWIGGREQMLLANMNWQLLWWSIHHHPFPPNLHDKSNSSSDNQARMFRFINPVPRLNKLCHILVYYQCSLSKSDASEITRFKMSQLQLLLLHLWIPNIVITGPCRYRFTGEELLIVCLTYIASGMPWTYYWV